MLRLPFWHSHYRFDLHIHITDLNEDLKADERGKWGIIVLGLKQKGAPKTSNTCVNKVKGEGVRPEPTQGMGTRNSLNAPAQRYFYAIPPPPGNSVITSRTHKPFIHSLIAQEYILCHIIQLRNYGEKETSWSSWDMSLRTSF